MDHQDELAFHALDLFPLRVARIQPLRKSDNLTWKIEDADGLAGVLGYCAFQIDNPAQMEWLTRRIPRLAAGECRSYLSGQTIYLDPEGI